MWRVASHAQSKKICEVKQRGTGLVLLRLVFFPVLQLATSVTKVGFGCDCQEEASFLLSQQILLLSQ